MTRKVNLFIEDFYSFSTNKKSSSLFLFILFKVWVNPLTRFPPHYILIDLGIILVFLATLLPDVRSRTKDDRKRSFSWSRETSLSTKTLTPSFISSFSLECYHPPTPTVPWCPRLTFSRVIGFDPAELIVLVTYWVSYFIYRCSGITYLLIYQFMAPLSYLYRGHVCRRFINHIDEVGVLPPRIEGWENSKIHTLRVSLKEGFSWQTFPPLSHWNATFPTTCDGGGPLLQSQLSVLSTTVIHRSYTTSLRTWNRFITT